MNRNRISQQALECLIRLMVNGESATCPCLSRDTIPFHVIWNLARYNKVTYVLQHYLSCLECAPRLTKKERALCLTQTGSGRHTMLLLQEREVRTLQTLAAQFHFRYVLFKDMSAVSEIPSQKFHVTGSDIDALVLSQDIARIVEYYRQQKYVVIPKEPKEYNLISPRTHVMIDVQNTVAFPPFGDGDIADLFAIQQVNALCLAGKTPYVSRELLLIILVVRYWSHELCRGLRQIQDVYEISLRYEKSLSWKYVTATLLKIGYLSRYQAMLLIGKKLFGYKKYPSYMRQIPVLPRISWVARVIDPLDVAYLDNILLWWSLHKKQAKQWLVISWFFNCLCDSKYSFMRMIRPRFFPILLRYAYRNARQNLWE